MKNIYPIKHILVFAILALSNLAKATDVSGIIKKDTIWDNKSEPYNIIDMVQIKQGVKLTIMEGVIVDGGPLDWNKPTNDIRVFGKLVTEGKPGNYVVFKNVKVGIGDSVGGWEIYLKNTLFAGGRCFHKYGNHSPGTTIIEGCIFFNTSDMGLYKPNAFTITENVFFNCRGFQSNTFSSADSGNFEITKNIFYIEPSNGSADSTFIRSSSHNKKWLISKNSFITSPNNSYAIKLDGSSYSDINAAHNYFNTTDESLIQKYIWDNNDDLEVSNKINFKPYLADHDSAVKNLPTFKSEIKLMPQKDKYKTTDRLTLEASVFFDFMPKLNVFDFDQYQNLEVSFKYKWMSDESIIGENAQLEFIDLKSISLNKKITLSVDHPLLHRCR